MPPPVTCLRRLKTNVTAHCSSETSACFNSCTLIWVHLCVYLSHIPQLLFHRAMSDIPVDNSADTDASSLDASKAKAPLLMSCLKDRHEYSERAFKMHCRQLNVDRLQGYETRGVCFRTKQDMVRYAFHHGVSAWDAALLFRDPSTVPLVTVTPTTRSEKAFKAHCIASAIAGCPWKFANVAELQAYTCEHGLVLEQAAAILSSD
jgi:hypothetical protein